MKNRSTIIGLFIIAILVFGAIYTLLIRPSYYKFNGGEVYLAPQNSTPFNKEFVDMKIIDGYIYECNKNGLIKKDLEGDSIWSKGYYIETPYMVSAGEYIAVADITGKSVYVFNRDGFLRLVKESNPIIDIYINKEGFLSVVQENDKQNLINYYNKEGALVIERATLFNEHGYPIDLVTSPDVSKMVTGYLDVTENRLQTKITFLGFDDKYDSYDENIIGGFTYEDALLSDIYWIGESNILAVMDKQLVFFNCDQEPQIVKTVEVESEIMDLVVNDETVAIWFGKAITESSNNHENSVVAYSPDGDLLDSATYDERILGLSGGQDAYFVMTSSQVIKYIHGHRQWFSKTYLTLDGFYYGLGDIYVGLTKQGYKTLKMQTQ